jgi:hypothetical protein
MTPYEKARQLKESFNHALTTRDCAMVCVDEIFEYFLYDEIESKIDRIDIVLFWIEVKKELKKL